MTKLRQWRRIKPYEWLDRELGPIHPVRVVGGKPMQVLIETDQGAIFYWVFDRDDVSDKFSSLVLHLTDEEALAVTKNGDVNVGTLEPVRRRLRDTSAYVAVESARNTVERAGSITIDRTASEAAFVASLRRAARAARSVEDLQAQAEAQSSGVDVVGFVPIDRLERLGLVAAS